MSGVESLISHGIALEMVRPRLPSGLSQITSRFESQVQSRESFQRSLASGLSPLRPRIVPPCPEDAVQAKVRKRNWAFEERLTTALHQAANIEASLSDLNCRPCG